jgi:serine O-acetyltransferase
MTTAPVSGISNLQTETAAAPRRALLAQIREDYIAHGRDWTKPGFRAMAVYRFGVWRMTIRSKLIRAPFSILYRRWFRKVRNRYGIELPYSAILGRRVIIEHQSCIVIHGSCVIGDDCIIRQGVTLGNRHLEKPLEAPVLGRAVNIGAGAKILGNVHIGDHANIGANAVVLTDVPAHALAVGIPARIIERSPTVVVPLEKHS